MSNCNRTAKNQQQQKAQRIEKQVELSGSHRFFNLLTGPELLEVVEENLPEHRERHYPPTETLSMLLSQITSADGSCQNTVNERNVSRALCGLAPLSTSTGGYCLARKRLPLKMVEALTLETGKLLEDHVPQAWMWKGRVVKLVDGTTVTLADSKDNQEQFPQHGNQAQGVGFPIARLVGVTSLSTGAVLAAAMGPYKGKGTGEHGLFRELRDAFTEGDLMLADGYYCSYFLIADMQSRGVDVVFEQHGARNTDFRRGQSLGSRDHVVSWPKPARPQWMSKEEYAAYPSILEMREIRVRKKVLVTTLLSPKKFRKNELGVLYVDRWQVELDIRNIKTTLGMELLKCKTVEMCKKEMWAYFLAYNLIRLLMAEAAVLADIMPRQLSFKHTVQIWTSWSQKQGLIEGDAEVERLFELIAQKRVGNRPNRVEPRSIKRRPKPFKRLDVSRHQARTDIEKKGHGRKLGLN